MSKKNKKKQAAQQEPEGFSMLGFFRKYEKTFLLVLLAPALLSMGVTGVMLSVFSDPGDSSAGKLFGETVTHKQFEDVAGLYRRVNRAVDDEQAWQFLALLRAADRAGIEVSDQEVGDEIRSTFRWEILRYLAEKEVKARGMDIGTEEGQQMFNQVMLEKIDQADFDEDIYREILEKRQGMDVRAYELQRQRSAKVSRLLDVLREMAVVSPDEVWEAYQEKNHKRVAEYVAVSGADYAPDPDEDDPESPHFIKPEDLDVFFENASERGFYDQPRQVDMRYLSYSFNSAELDIEDAFGAIDDQTLADHYRDHFTATVAVIGTDVPFEKLGEPELEMIRELVIEDMALERVDLVMNRVADLVAEADAAGALADLDAIRAKVQDELKATGIVVGSTGLVEEDAAGTHEDLAGNTIRRYFRGLHDETKTTDVLAGQHAWFVVRTTDVKEAKQLTRQEVEDHLRTDYAHGTKGEQRAYYDKNKHEQYMRPPAFRVEYAVANAEDFEGETDEAKLEQAKQAMTKALEIASGWDRGFDWDKFDIDAAVPSAVEVGIHEQIDRAELDEDPILGAVAADVSFSPLRELSTHVAERKDGKGYVLFRKLKEFPQELQAFDAVQEEIQTAIAEQRGFNRAKRAASALLDDLARLTGEALKAKLNELGLEAKRTEPIERGDIALDDFPTATGLVTLVFRDSLEIDGPFADSWNDDVGEQILLVRVAEKIDADDDKYEDAYFTLRTELLDKVRGEFAAEQSQRILLEAKGIDPEHVSYATAHRDGPDGQTQVTLRQIFLPPSKEIIDSWLEEKALEDIKQARKALDDGQSWNLVVTTYSEDENSSGLRGSLPPVGRGDLVVSHGLDFVEAIFDLPEKVVSQPILSEEGYHLVQKWQTLDDGKVEFRHILVRTDAALRELPDAVMQQAKDATKTQMQQALERLEQGEPFAIVADEVGSTDDPIARGETFTSDYLTPLELAALAQPLEWQSDEGAAATPDLYFPEAVQVTDAAGETRWHWFACGRDRGDDTRLDMGSARRDRVVYHIVTKDEKKMKRAQKEMTAWLEEQVEKDGRPGFPTIRRQFSELAREYSEAPDAAKGGAFGVLRISDDVRRYGLTFLERTSRKADGTPVEPGFRTDVVEDEAGYHILLVDKVDTKQPTERERFLQVARYLLQGSDWE